MLQPEKTCLLIADISGYTEYLTGVEIDHAQDILADLVSTVVTTLRPGFQLSKLEGDAAFCYAPAEEVDGSMLLDTIERCYFGFRRRRRDVGQATSCECRACTRIPNLNLKFVAHHGLVIHQTIAGSSELLGSDVIAVHRLVKNDIVAATGVTAYAAFTDALTKEMSIDPMALGMAQHSETYEHLGELKVWVHDLERRWLEEDERTRVIVKPEEAIYDSSVEVDAPPQIVWEYATTPGRRLEWQFASGVTEVVEKLNEAGRRGVGTVNHCMHGPDASIEEILDWRPFDYLTGRSSRAGAPTMVFTYEFEPTPTGTRVSFRIAKPDNEEDLKILTQVGPMLADSYMKSIQVLQGLARNEANERLATRDEPPLPERRNADGFLADIPPIQYVG